MDKERYELVCDRLDHLEGRVDDLETDEEQDDHKRGMRWSLILAWVTVLLIVVEIVEAVLIARHWS